MNSILSIKSEKRQRTWPSLLLPTPQLCKIYSTKKKNALKKDLLLKRKDLNATKMDIFRYFGKAIVKQKWPILGVNLILSSLSKRVIFQNLFTSR